MDALAHLALMTKAKAVFESDATFLSFPALTPLSYTADALRFATGTAPSAAQLRMMSEFSRVVNSLPAGTLFEPTPDHTLWDAYQSVLQTALLAGGAMNDDQKSALALAEAVLHVTNADGLRADSPNVLAYNQCRDAWFTAQQNYNTQKSTALASTDPAVLARWNNVDEPGLRAAVEDANLAWTNTGNKVLVEAARHEEAAAAAQSPRQIWQGWAGRFVPDLDLMTDQDNQSFALSGFTPANIVDTDDWPSFTLTSAEITQLVAAAPPELSAIFTEQPGATGIDSLSFEYRSVAVNRPWFYPEMFSARFWKLPDGATPLSDGATPPAGNWPAYVTAVIFARNITVHAHTNTGAAQAVALRSFAPINQRLDFVHAVEPITNRPIVRVVPAPIAIRPVAPAVVVLRRTAAVGIVAPHLGGALPAAVHPPLATMMLRLNPALLGGVHVLPPRPVGPTLAPPHPPPPPPAVTAPTATATATATCTSDTAGSAGNLDPCIHMQAPAEIAQSRSLARLERLIPGLTRRWREARRSAGGIFSF